MTTSAQTPGILWQKGTFLTKDGLSEVCWPPFSFPPLRLTFLRSALEKSLLREWICRRLLSSGLIPVSKHAACRLRSAEVAEFFVEDRCFDSGLQFWTQKSGGVSDCLLLPLSWLSSCMWHHADEGQADLCSFLTHWILAMAVGGRRQWFDLTGQEVAHQQ